MRLCDSTKVYKIQWASEMDFVRFRKLLEDKISEPYRVLTISTQKQRIALNLVPGEGPVLIPYEYNEGAWRMLHARDVRVSEVTPEMYRSEYILRDALVKEMILQFRDSVEGYYEEYPTAEQIRAHVLTHPTKKMLRDMRYTFFDAEVQPDPDWDGAIEVHCQGGVILFPYRGDLERDADEDVILLPEHATFVPESKVVNGANRVAEFFENCVSGLANIGWSSFRRHVDNVWR